MSYSRYSRQELFLPIGRSGQSQLNRSRVAVVGMGALGTVSATQLVRAGVGFVRVIDRDVIEHSNLQRQSLYDEIDASAGRAKAEAAAEKLRNANRDVVIEDRIEDVEPRNAERLLSDVDVIIDGTDNYQVRYIINDVAVKQHIPWSYAGVVSSYGTTAFFRPGETPCFVCLLGENAEGGQETCETVGVIAPVVSMIASIQVAETLKYLTGNYENLSNSVVYVDVWQNLFQTMHFGSQHDDCRSCVKHQFTALSSSTSDMVISMCGRHVVQVRPPFPLDVHMADMAERLSKFGVIRHNAHLLRCDFGETQMTLFADGRALFHGIDDAPTARSLYAKYVGT